MKHSQTSDLPDTKRHLLDAGINLMRKQGFNATSVDEICLEAEVTKGAFFHYFKSKEDLAKAAILWFQENRIASFAEAPFRQLSDPLDRLFARLDYAKESYSDPNHRTKGCLFGMFAQEMSFMNPSLRGLCLDAFLQNAADLEKDLAAAKAAHAPHASFDPKKVAVFYISLVQGSLILAKVSESNDVFVENIEQFRTYLQGLFAPSTPPHETHAPMSADAKN